MPAAVLVRPDTDFIRAVLGSGGEDLKKCYQCATCSTICELSPESEPFPRKQMIEAQWGLKERLMTDPALWLCHNCGRCTTYCPRGARPGDVLGALRREVIKAFAYPAFLGRLVSNSRMWPVLFLVPTLIFAAILVWAPKGEPTAEMEFANAFPIPILEALFFAVAALVLAAFAMSIRRFARAMWSHEPGEIIRELIPALKTIATQERFSKCTDARLKYWGHLLTMWGFVGLAVVGTVVGIGTMLGVMRTPLAFLNPAKIFANICAGVILTGLACLLIARLSGRRDRPANTYFDWFFLLTLGGVVVTGIVAEILRSVQTGAMYPVYFVHLVLIFSLFLCALYSKFAHFLYRTFAIAAVMAADKRAKLPDVPIPVGGCRTCGIGARSANGQGVCNL